MLCNIMMITIIMTIIIINDHNDINDNSIQLKADQIYIYIYIYICTPIYIYIFFFISIFWNADINRL